MRIGSAHPTASDTDKITAVCAKVLELPFHWETCLTGQSMSVTLSEATGLSKSRIAEGGFDRLRPSTLEKARAFNLAKVHRAAREGGWPTSASQHLQVDSWTVPDETPAHLARLFALKGEIDGISLRRTAHIALKWESFAAELQRASLRNDLQLGLSLCQAFRAQLAQSERTTESEPLLTRIQVELVVDWATLTQMTERLMTFAYVDFFAQLDAEWGSQYFKTPRPTPLFLWIAPAIEWDAEGRRPRKRNGIRRPVRKLLELTYATAFRYYTGSWPPKAPGRSDIADVLDITDDQAGNYFDGTRHMRLNAFESWWTCLCKRLRTKAFDKPDLASPDMLARVALLWQHDWVHTKTDVVRSVILLDQELYLRRWKHHRDGLPTDHATTKEAWPEWLG